MLDLGITDAEIAATIEPFVVRRFPPGHSQWEEEVAATAHRFQRARRRHRLLHWMPGFSRTQQTVRRVYSQQWSDRAIEHQLAREGPTVACQWRDERMHARAVVTKRVHLLFLMRTIERLAPRRVLEVGCGNGLNLFLLGGRFPEIHFAGVELTAGGTSAFARVSRLPELPRPVRDFSPEPLRDTQLASRITFTRGDAALLPFRDAAFDLVFTALALEQMEPIRDRALRELRRVARSHVAMIEPFREWNDEGCARDYIVANDYFSGRIADLPGLGLHPLFATADMPSKLINHPGLVVCRVE